MSDLDYILNMGSGLPTLVSSKPMIKAIHFNNYPIQDVIMEIIVHNTFSDGSEIISEVRPPFRLPYTTGVDGTSKLEYPLIDFETQTGVPELVGKHVLEDLYNELKSWGMHFMALHLDVLQKAANLEKLQQQAEDGHKAIQTINQIQTGNIPAEFYDMKMQ